MTVITVCNDNLMGRIKSIDSLDLNSNLGHLLLPLSLGGLGVGVVVGLDQDEVVGLRVDHKLPGSVLQREGHLVENSSQLLQSQNPVNKFKFSESFEHFFIFFI